ncbi:MAG: 5'-nucleotidase C-terminal domain-containing protein [Holophagaceae bacterium]|uniref:5'-nucleotidase C-terminal domain-containing protein n=1 Tax=Candidatus Geothrix skivensis TaxID=2954439 RepID=A0A9D7XHH1_9BACT|nr:5'-nucleotidase C-terminal domain-containing protein [Candidatus Geothrix skivensis]
MKTEVIPITAAIADDEAIQKVITPLAAGIKATFGLPLVQAPQGLFRGRRGEENLLGYWVSDVMRQAAQAVIGSPVRFAITNAGGLRANLRPGLLKVGDIFEMMPFENELVVIELTGAEVIQVVKEGILRRGGEPCSGVKAVVAGSPESPTYTLVWEDGSPIDLSAVVKVATSDYLYGGGDSIPTLKQGRKPFTTGVTLRQMLLDHCAVLASAKQDLLAPAPGRYTIPVPILEAIRDKKFKL